MVTKLFPNVIEFASDFPQAIIDTLLMLVISGLISVVIGILLAVIVVVTRKDGLKENQPVFWILDKIINLFRSIPFIILIPTVAVLSRALFGTTIGIEGALVPLVIGTAPFVARQMESAIMEIDPGIIEASIAMGLSTKEIIFDVYLRENIPGMIRGLTISFIALVGQIAIVGSVGAGGLGDMAIRYGLQRSMGDITFVVIILILILISIVQAIGDKLVEKTSH
ncbi:ABC transporter permease [Catenibacterium sp. co_0103]|uniref:methionine ABC transporter permease n=1 Tax=unclassified Catenibacterium TaxID=2643636 RepID=UPI0010207609|nr:MULTISPECIES: methionine ABC transporter permease [unclassified Catenibacterium]MZT12800.1 ABC transporter permease subunit [Catenibacterium sp. BIOML-A1]RYT45778.1 ABC transporter permease [Catenibacterium sp. co_0103]